jgi:hypothetical protein
LGYIFESVVLKVFAKEGDKGSNNIKYHKIKTTI